MSHTNLHETAPTQFQDIGDVRLAYRRFGKEGAPPDSMPGMARDIIAFIRALGAGKVDLFAFSIGGMVGQQVVLDAPELVRRLLLVGTGPAGGEGMAEYTPQVKEIVSRPNSTEEERMLELFFSPTATSRAAGKAWLSRIGERKTDREPSASPQVAQAQLAALAKWGQVTGERYSALKAITHHTLVVNGSDDIMVPTINSFILQRELPDARLMLFPDSGHGSHFQFPEEFAEAAARFLAAD